MKKITPLLLSTLVLTLGARPTAVRAQTTQPVTTVYSFNSTDGANPKAPLVLGSDGNFYGTSTDGGDDSSGTVFRTTPAGTITTLHGFNFNSEGLGTHGLVQGQDGNFYGTTGTDYDNGNVNCPGVVFKITPAGVLTVLHTFSALNADGENSDGSNASALIQSSGGNFFGTTVAGGSGGNGTVFRITPAGVFTTLHAFSALNADGDSTDGANPPAGLVQGSDGNFYGTTDNGGGNGDGTVFKMTPAGVLTTLHSFAAIAAAYDDNSDGAAPSALIQGSDGSFYGTTFYGGSGGRGTVFRVTPAGVLTTLHNFTNSGPDGELPDAPLVQGRDGNFYGTTYYGDSFEDSGVFEITPAGKFTVLSDFGATGDTEGFGPAAALVAGRDGNFYGTTIYGGTSGVGTVFRLNVTPAITSAASATGEVGDAFSYQITATNAPTDYAATGLPAGLSVNAQTGLISGTPQKAGTFSVTFSATNAFAQAKATLSLTVAAAGTPHITSALTLAVPEDTAFSYQITATESPTAYGVQGLPSGVTVDSKTGLITGKHHGLGTLTLTLNAYNAKGKGLAADLTFRVYGAPIITSATTAMGTVGQPFTYQITARNSPTSFGVQGLPEGLTVDEDTGLISGTPKGVGTVTLTLNAYNAAGKGSASLTLTVAAK